MFPSKDTFSHKLNSHPSHRPQHHRNQVVSMLLTYLALISFAISIAWFRIFSSLTEIGFTVVGFFLFL